MKIISVFVAFALLLLTAPAASADINQFSGKWKNIDPNTRGMTTLHIDIKGVRVKVQAWGKCHPSDCAWGEAEGTAYGPGVGANLAETAQAISVIYNTGFSQTILIVRPIEGDQLQVESLTKFTDRSGRASYRSVEKFSRAEDAGVGK